MGVISTILGFFGCSSNSNKSDKVTEDFNDQITQSIENFNNRPIHRVLTKKLIETTLDDNLLQVVFDNLSEKIPEDYNKEYEVVTGWNNSRQAIYLIWILEAEVNNGGYNQFYFNSSGRYYKKLPKALRLVGANKFGELTERSNNLFEAASDNIKKHQDGTLEGFSESYDDNPLNDLDDEFYELYKLEELHQIQIEYIRNNIEQFIDR